VACFGASLAAARATRSRLDSRSSEKRLEQARFGSKGDFRDENSASAGAPQTPPRGRRGVIPCRFGGAEL